MRFSIVVLALTGAASALPALSGAATRQPTALVDRSSEVVSAADDLSRRGFKAEVMPASDGTNSKRRSLEVETRQTGGNGSLNAEAIGDNKVNPTTGLTDSEAAEIVTGIDLKDKKAPGSLNAKGQRNPLPGLSADETDAIIKQGQAALKEAGA